MLQHRKVTAWDTQTLIEEEGYYRSERNRLWSLKRIYQLQNRDKWRVLRKGKVHPRQVMKSQRGIRSIALHFP
jgi:hypothetical protein